MQSKIFGGAVCAAIFSTAAAEACSRALYIGEDGTNVTVRSMDWRNEPSTDLWVFPRGLERRGAVGDRSLTWTSRYGSVVASAFDAAAVDGLNEEGLAANLLYLTGSDYPDLDAHEGDAVAVSAWTQYMLEMFATVDEAVAAMRADPRCSSQPA
ncbi:linear amide C-N hydrolase [Acuticoccus sp.]|uniref:linear amide C-N hydrolase n=1 Tax=Acuticoccus sp. TaxID=1904378 RepID=UPI003B520A76